MGLRLSIDAGIIRQSTLRKKRLMKTFRTLLAFGALLLLANGCKKQPLDNMTNDESRIYITDHDSSVNFSNYHTFSVSDSAALITNNKVEKQLEPIDAAYIDAVKNIMQSRGFVLVNKSENPDLGITVNHIISTTTGVISNNSYWNDYGTYWDPYYWGYPGYNYYLPYSYSVYQISEGAISVDMVDLKNAAEKDQLNVIWTGLIRGSGIFDQAIAKSQVQALFDQSPYLKTP